MEYVKK